MTLTAKDAYGNQESAGGLTVAFSVASGPTGGKFGTVTDNKNGTYTATFTAPTAAGIDHITASIGGQPVTSTPASLTVVPGAVSLSGSTVSLSPASVMAGMTTVVTLVARDAYGNQELTGGLVVAFALGTGKGSGTLSAVTDNHNGTYSAVLTATTMGTNTISAKIGGGAVTSTAPTLTVTPGPLSLSTSVVTLSSASVALDGTATVTLTTRDAAGNQETSGGLTVSIATSAPEADRARLVQ